MDPIQTVIDLRKEIVEIKNKKTKLETRISLLKEEKNKIMDELKQYNLTPETVQGYISNSIQKLEEMKDKLNKMSKLLEKIV